MAKDSTHFEVLHRLNVAYPPLSKYREVPGVTTRCSAPVDLCVPGY